VFGEDVTFTATAVPEPGAPLLNDTVTFVADAGTPNQITFIAPVDPATGTAVFNPRTVSGHPLGVGAHPITADFNSNGVFAPYSASLTQQVNKANTSMTLSSNPANPYIGQTVVVFASVLPVAPGAGQPSGTVTFTVDGTTGSPVNLVSGQA